MSSEFSFVGRSLTPNSSEHDEKQEAMGRKDNAMWPATPPRSDGQNSISTISDEEKEGGVLILSGSESPWGDDGRLLRTMERTHELLQAALELSLPGTESLPSEVRSIDVTTATNKRDMFLDTHSSSDDDSSLENKLFEDNDDRSKESDVPQSNPKTTRFRAQFGAILLLTALLAHVAYDRHVWRLRSMQTENELLEVRRQLTIVMNRSETTLDRKSSENGNDDNDDDTKWYDIYDDFDWENEDFLKEQDFVLADNCWFKATVQLGDCGATAKDCVAGIAQGVFGAFSKIGSNLMTGQSASFVGSIDRPLHTAGFTLDALTEVSHIVGTLASASVDAVDAVGHVMDQSILYTLEQVRDAIREASFTLDFDGDEQS